MIERHWKGIARSTEADNYIKHLLEDTFPKLKSIDGFLKASILKRTVANGVEFLIVTVWESYEPIKRFAGTDPSVAVVPDLVQAMMIEFERNVVHYEVVE